MGAFWAIALIAAVAVIATVLSVGGGDNLPSDAKVIDGAVVTCSSEVTPDVLFQAYDADNPGTAITEAGIYRQKGTKSWLSFTAGTEETGLIPGATYEVVPGITTSDFTDNAYGAMFEYTAKCQEDDTVEFEMYNDEIETSLSATFYNKDDNAAAQTFVAGDQYDVSIRLKAGSDEYFGNPTLENAGVLVLKLNKTEWDVPNEVRIGNDVLARVSTPLRYGEQATGFIEYAYELPAIGDREVSVILSLDADDTNAPSVDGTAYIYAGGYFVESDTADIGFGVETSEGTAVGTDAADSVTLDFTA